jgi:hypothetical protein
MDEIDPKVLAHVSGGDAPNVDRNTVGPFTSETSRTNYGICVSDGQDIANRQYPDTRSWWQKLPIIGTADPNQQRRDSAIGKIASACDRAFPGG